MKRYGLPALPHAEGELLERRVWLHLVGAAGLSGLLSAGCARRPQGLSTAPDTARGLRFPEKISLRALNDRAPCLETPWRSFRHDLTPNDAFYVRWHLAAIPTQVDLRT